MGFGDLRDEEKRKTKKETKGNESEENGGETSKAACKYQSLNADVTTSS